jgi:hypothetical protein
MKVIEGLFNPEQTRERRKYMSQYPGFFWLRSRQHTPLEWLTTAPLSCPCDPDYMQLGEVTL